MEKHFYKFLEINDQLDRKSGIMHSMKATLKRLGILPYLILGLSLTVLGLMAMNHAVDNWWPFDVARLDLVRATALDQVDPAALMESVNVDIVFAFLCAVVVVATGIALPIVYFLNRRFSDQKPHFLVVLRQSMWIGFWVSFCLYLQMNRMLGIAIALLVAAVLVLFEFIVQIRTRASSVTI
jgi:hypothetical protein